MAKLIVGSREFPSHKAARDHYSAVLHGYEIGEELTLADHYDVLALLQRHPWRDQKIGAGASHFTVERTLYGQRGFFVHRVDGSCTDFSYLTCIRGDHQPPKTKVLTALRAVVSLDILEAKRAYFDANRVTFEHVVCVATGQLITFDDAHADHEAPWTFEVLAESFAASKNMSLDSIKLNQIGDMQIGPGSIDPALAAEFRSYHNRLARIRVVAKTYNLQAAAAHKLKNKSDDHLALPL